MKQKIDSSVVSTGIEGLDACMGGGFPANRLYLIEGDPGVGKTTLALQFLLDGRDKGEKVLLVSLAESSDELSSVAASHGWDLKGLEFFNISPAQFGYDEEYTILQPAEIELSDTIKSIIAEIDRVQPARVVFDSLSEIRLLSQSPLRFRRQILALKQHLAGRKSTVLLLDDRTSASPDLTIQSLVHGVIELQKYSPIFGKARRKLQVSKLRGVNFQAGFHDFLIGRGGLHVFPRLVAAQHHVEFKNERLSSGIKELDDLAGGGLDRGTANLIVGPAGCGKSSLAILFAVAAAERGENAAIFAFDEGLHTMLQRATALNMDLRPHIESGKIHLQQVDPAEMSPGEFMWQVKQVIEQKKATTVVVDSLTGYLDSMPESQFLTIQMHEMLTYLNQRGILTILTMAQHGFIGDSMTTQADVSYLSDTVFLIRFFESSGEVRKAISILKKRSSRHEHTIREYQLGPDRIRLGKPLTDFRGVLTGVPEFIGNREQMMKANDAAKF